MKVTQEEIDTIIAEHSIDELKDLIEEYSGNVKELNEHVAELKQVKALCDKYNLVLNFPIYSGKLMSYMESIYAFNKIIIQCRDAINESNG